MARQSVQGAVVAALLAICCAARRSPHHPGDSYLEAIADRAEGSGRLHPEVSDSFLEEWINTSSAQGGISYLALREQLLSQSSTSKFEDQFLSQSSTSKFDCPWPCLECCMAENNVYLNVGLTTIGKRDSTSFKCVFSATQEAHVEAGLMKDRTCTAITYRNSDSSLATKIFKKTYCSLTPAEQKSVGENLPQCESKLISGYTWFIGSCNVALGAAVERMYFHVEHSVMDGVCMSKGKEFAKAGRFGASCAKKCATQGDACNECMKTQLCNVIKPDLSTGRLDKFAMAIWAAGVGAELIVDEIPKPVSNPKALQRVIIPGWSSKAAAFTTPPEDYQINLAMGGFQCMMSKLQSLPMVDDLTDDKNVYVSSGGPESPEATNFNYFSGYGLYQQPLHFAVPADQLFTDKTLERLVFEAIGAHRLELLHEGKPVQVLNPMVPLLPMSDTVPEGSRFAVRMEGLFEDLPLREGMARWGGNAFFTSDGALLAIQYNGETVTFNDFTTDQSVLRKREYFKFVFRSSLVSTITAFDHLVATHILVSETLALATVEMLPPLHMLRLLISPHIYKTLDINFKAANNLFPKNMLVHRASPYADGAFTQGKSDGLLWQKARVLQYRTFEFLYSEYLEMRKGEPRMPTLAFFEDGKLVYEAVSAHVKRTLAKAYGAEMEAEGCSAALQADNYARRFVLRFFDMSDLGTPDFYPASFRQAADSCEALHKLLTEMLFLVSGWHTHVGSVPDFFRDTRFAATAWKEGESSPRPKHSMMMMLLAATTAADMPTYLSDSEKLFVQWQDIARKPDFPALRDSMQQVQATISQRNEERSSAEVLAFHQMEPQYVQWGVYV